MKRTSLGSGKSRERSYSRLQSPLRHAIEPLESRVLLSSPYLVSIEIDDMETPPVPEENTWVRLKLVVADPDDNPVTNIGIWWNDTTIDDYIEGVDYFWDPQTLSATLYVTHVYEDDSSQLPNNQYLLTVMMQDDQYEYGEDFFGLQVINMAPWTGSFTLSNGNEGGAFDVRNVSRFNGVYDPSPIDQLNMGFTTATSIGGLAQDYYSAMAGETNDHVFDDNGPITMYGQLIDKNEAKSPVYSASAMVVSVAPYGTLNVSEPDVYGEVTVTLNGLWDPSIADSNAGQRLAFSTDFDSLPTTFLGDGTQTGTTRIFSEAEMTGATAVWVRVFDKDNAYRTYSRGITDMSAAVAGTSQINLTWTDNVGGETGWRVQWSDDGSFTEGHMWYVNLPPNTNHYEVINVPEGTRRWYRARAYDIWGNGNDSIYSPKMAATTLLIAPTNVTPTLVSSHGGQVSWIDHSTVESGYNVYRSTSISGPYDLVGVLPANAETYNDPRLTDYTTYYYQVEAFNDDVNSILTAPESLVVPLAAPLNVMASNLNNTNHEVVVRWDIANTNHSEYVIEAFAEGVDVTTATPVATGTVAGNVNTYMFSGLNGLHQFTVTSQAAGAAAAESGPVENRTEASATVLIPYSASGSGSATGAGVTAAWSPSTAQDTFGGGISVENRFYGNGTVTLELTGLPRHSYAGVHMFLNIYSNYPESSSVLTATAGGTSLRVQRAVNPDPEMHPNYGVWYVGPGEEGTPMPNGFDHSSSTLTVTLEMADLAAGHYWGISETWVDTYLPFVTIAGPASVSEASTTPATFTVTRTGSYTRISEPLTVGIRPSGTATSGTDYQQADTTVTIEAGHTSATFSVQPIDDGDIEPHETMIFEVVPSENYSWTDATANPPAAPPKAQATIFDDDIIVVLVGGLGQHGAGGDSVNPSTSAGINEYKSNLTAVGIHSDSIFTSSSDKPNPAQAAVRVEQEIKRRVNLGGGRTVKVAMIGYSWGGGLIYNVSAWMDAMRVIELIAPYDLFFTGYIDAIQLGEDGRNLDFAQRLKPIGSAYHMNFYQSKPGDPEDLFASIHGDATTDLSETDPPNVDVDAISNYTSHSKIDKDPFIRAAIVYQLIQHK